MTVDKQTVAPLPKSLAANPLLSRWVAVDTDGTIRLQVGKVELGQGVLTALAQIAVDELDVALDAVTMVAASTSGPNEGLTAGSMSILDSGPAVRLVCANVRARFVAEAARRWGVAEPLVRVEAGALHGPTHDLCTAYAALAGVVDLDVHPDPSVLPRPTGDADSVGASAPRIDLPDKIAGRPRFIHDVRLPGQRYGRVIRPSSPGATLTSVAALPADLEGLTVVRDGSFLGIVGDDEATVVRAAEVLRAAATWREQEQLPDEDDLPSYLRAGPHDTLEVLDAAVSSGPHKASGTRHAASYSRPFLAHASIAPSCGVARWETDGSLSVWSHSQGIFPLRGAIAQALRLDADQVRVTHVENAGCYGHNAADDAAFDAVLLARSCVGTPVQVQWSRADELAWAPFGSAMTADAEVTLDEHTGRLSSWSYDVWSQGHTSRPGYSGTPGLLGAASMQEAWQLPPAADPPLAAGGGTTRNAVPIYAIDGVQVRGHRLLRSPLRSSALRALGAYFNVFAIESFMDELALAAGADPVEFRLRHLSDDRAATVLARAAEAAGWGETVPEGIGRGVGFARYKDRGAYCAVVAEVEAEHDIRVRRLSIAVDVGRVVNPDGVRNQIEGGATQSTSWTLKERVRFNRQRVLSDDWETYPILRFGEAPDVDVHVVSRPDLPSVGAGEAAQGPTAAAIANAVADAIGVRVRDLPLTTDAVVAAIESAD